MPTWNDLAQFDFAAQPDTSALFAEEGKHRRCADCGLVSPRDYEQCPIDERRLLWDDDPVFTPDFAPEGRLSSRYDIVRLVGKGNLTFVFEAKDLASGNPFAIKVLRGDFITNHQMLKGFEKEIIVCTMLAHKNIAPPQAYGYAKKTFHPRPYLVHEFLHGINLAQLLAHFGPMEPKHALPIFEQICEALEFAHQMNTPHREIKPSNIYVVAASGDAMVKVIDFGVSERVFHVVDEHEIRTSRNVTAVGDPLYMAPEAVRIMPNQKSDIYSLGCVFYEALTNIPPFKGKTDFDTLYRHSKEDAPPFAAELSIPSSISELIFNMLDKDPDKRPTASDSRSRLQRIQSLI